MALVLFVLAFGAVADTIDLVSSSSSTTSSTSTSTSSTPPLQTPHHHRRHRRRGPVLGPRTVTGVVRREQPTSKKNEQARAPSLSPSHPTDLLQRCRERWRDATLDHFSQWRPRRSADIDDAEGLIGKTNKNKCHHHDDKKITPKTFRQRYFVCDDQWAGPGSPIFFYFGNEADVTLYLNATGLMWQSAPAFGAALVFAEHR